MRATGKDVPCLSIFFYALWYLLCLRPCPVHMQDVQYMRAPEAGR